MARASARIRALVALAVVCSFLQCGPTASPRRAAPGPAPSGRAVLISFDSLAGARLERLLSDPAKLPSGAFRRLAARGFHAIRSVPPTPSLTAVSHITHVTGALPERTGIVSNTFRDLTKPFPDTISGFAAPIRAETLWQAARRQGRRVGVMSYPGADANGPERTADWMMTWPGDPLAPGARWSLPKSAWEAVEPGAAPKSFSPLLRATLAFGKTSYTARILAVDGTDDGKVDYDHVLFEGREVRVGEWFPVEVASPEGRTGAWCRLMALVPDLSGAEIYLGPLGRSTGFPANWVRTLDEKIGFWPGVPDSTTFGADSNRPELFLEQADRLVDFLTRADLLAAARSDWDLLLIYQPEIDETGHEFLLVDPRQPRFTPERSARFLGFVEQSYALADRSLDAIERALRPDDSLFVTGDHGMTAIWAEISIIDILREAGLVRLDADRKVSASSPLLPVPASGIVHIYRNPRAGPDVIDRAERIVRGFRVGGESPFDRIVRREDAKDLGLQAPESGDLIVLARPGYLFAKEARADGALVGERGDYGGHGYRNVYPEVDATLFAAGPGIPHQVVDSIGSWEIAALVAKAIGIAPPFNAASTSRWLRF